VRLLLQKRTQILNEALRSTSANRGKLTLLIRRPWDDMWRSSWCLRALAGLLFLLQLGLRATARADTDGSAGYETLAIPFPFYNESFGFGAGYV
jgi:hypothetical protein